MLTPRQQTEWRIAMKDAGGSFPTCQSLLCLTFNEAWNVLSPTQLDMEGDLSSRLAQDRAERKRMLGVIAQRRYSMSRCMSVLMPSRPLT